MLPFDIDRRADVPHLLTRIALVRLHQNPISITCGLDTDLMIEDALGK